jgi:iron complex transport system permease protein
VSPAVAVLTPSRRRAVWLLGALACVAAVGFGMAAGPSGLSLAWLSDDEVRSSVLSLRGARVALAILVGAALSMTGAALQALLRNPLADPYIIGVSGGAALGGALAVTAAGALAAVAVPTGAVAGAFLASAGLGWFVAREGRGRTDGTLLAGVVFNAFASAIITLIKTLLPAERSYALLFWLVGTLGYPDATTLLFVIAAVLAGGAALLGLSGRLDVLALGDDEALRLGVSPLATKLLAYAAASLLVGAVVPVTGMIGFVGLVVPHALRLVLGSDMRLLVGASGLFGAAVLVVFDGAARLSFGVLGTELPVGALTALVGAPLFALSLARRLRGGAR